MAVGITNNFVNLHNGSRRELLSHVTNTRTQTLGTQGRRRAHDAAWKAQGDFPVRCLPRQAPASRSLDTGQVTGWGHTATGPGANLEPSASTASFGRDTREPPGTRAGARSRLRSGREGGVAPHGACAPAPPRPCLRGPSPGQLRLRPLPLLRQDGPGVRGDRERRGRAGSQHGARSPPRWPGPRLVWTAASCGGHAGAERSAVDAVCPRQEGVTEREHASFSHSDSGFRRTAARLSLGERERSVRAPTGGAACEARGPTHVPVRPFSIALPP